MSRYIDADRLRKDILGLPNCYNGFSDTYDKALIIDRIDEQPTANVRENVSGEWKMTITAYPYCSNCGWMPEEDEMTHGFYDFCPNCGAEMQRNGETL